MKRTFLVATMATLMTLTTSGTALARGHGPGGPGGHGGPGGPGRDRGCMGQALKAANLTPDQQQRLKEMRKQQKEKMEPLRGQLKAKAGELRALWQAEQPNRSALLAKHEEMDAIRRQMRTAQIDHRLAMYGALTPDQRAAFRAKAQACGMDDEGPGHRGPHGPPGPAGEGPDGEGPGPRGCQQHDGACPLDE